MAFRLDSILNPSSPAPERNEPSARVASTYEAAATLTALSSGAPSYSSSYAYSNPPSAQPQAAYHSPTNSYSGDGRPGSSYGSHAMPLEPSPPLERAPPSFSSGLQQYHHGSRSPEQQRRESFAHQSDYATHLPPIQRIAQVDDRPSSASDDRSATYVRDMLKTTTGSYGTDNNNAAHHAEPGYTRDLPATSPIQQASPSRPNFDLKPQHEHHQHQPQVPDKEAFDARSSLTPHIKHEPTLSPSTTTPQVSESTNMDDETAKAIAAAANEHGTRGVRAKPTTEQPASLDLEPSPVPKKKAPTAKVGTKKGVARKPAPKKRRLEDEDTRSISPVGAASKTTATFRGGTSKSNTPHLASSPTPVSRETSAPLDDGEGEGEGDDGSDNELYCICRKPDNHSWMIACDGGCDDWFHGKCVKMKEEQGELIDKYICPNCQRVGKGVTTWKPGCRRDGCNRPAEIRKDKQSKYCSDECGREFMREKLGLDSERSSKKQKKRGNLNETTDGMDVDEEDDLGPRGGPLRPGDVRAMLDASKNVDDFRSLGDGVLSPPATASPDKPNSDAEAINGTTTDGDQLSKPSSDAPLPQPPSYTLTPQEAMRIQDISDAQDRLTRKRVTLRDRERLVKMVVDQASRYAEKQGAKPKDVCGYDSRLAWPDAEFERWRESQTGRDALRLGTLDVPVSSTTDNGVKAENGQDGEEEGVAANENKGADTDMPDAKHNDTDKDGANGTGVGFCTRKRCEQHRQWQKNELTGVRAELVDLSDEANRLAKEEREMREQAFRRWKGEQGSSSNKDSSKDGMDQRAEGWVEVL